MGFSHLISFHSKKYECKYTYKYSFRNQDFEDKKIVQIKLRLTTILGSCSICQTLLEINKFYQLSTLECLNQKKGHSDRTTTSASMFKIYILVKLYGACKFFMERGCVQTQDLVCKGRRNVSKRKNVCVLVKPYGACKLGALLIKKIRMNHFNVAIPFLV